VIQDSGHTFRQATLANLGHVQSSHYRDRGSPESARAAVEGHRRCWQCFVAVILRPP
jgi:hypothetical protein